MPTSHHLQINEIVDLIVLTDPQSLLDIGVGFGKYGFLAREYLELWDGREKYSDWKRVIDGIEVFKEYLTPVHDFIYNNIFIGNAIDVLDKIHYNYELILLADVFEHFDYEDGITLLNKCLKVGKNIILSIPNSIGEQSDSFGNQYETHKFQWKAIHFDKFRKKFIIPNVAGSMIIYIGDKSEKVISEWKKHHSLKRKVEKQVLKTLHLKDLERMIKGIFKK